MVITEETKSVTKFKVGGEEFDTRKQAEAHIARKQAEAWRKAIDDADDFEVLPDHLKLFRHANFQTFSDATVAIDPKRPFGNSAYLDDIAEIIELELFEDAGGDKHLTGEQERLCEQRYRELKNFFDILCQFGEIPSGSYTRFASYQPWRKVHIDVIEIDGMISPDGEEIAYRVDGGEIVSYAECFDRARNATESLWNRAFEMTFDDYAGPSGSIIPCKARQLWSLGWKVIEVDPDNKRTTTIGKIFGRLEAVSGKPKFMIERADGKGGFLEWPDRFSNIDAAQAKVRER